jgi:cation:H+ antiporter
MIVAAGTFLARCADTIAEVTGLGRLLIGSVLLAAATSLPELTVDISAIRQGMADLAVGDLLGSSLMNLSILAVLDLTHRSRGKMLSRAAAGHALSGTMSIAMTALVGLAILAAPQIPAWSVLGASVPAWMILGAYCLGVRMVFLDQRLSASLTGGALPLSFVTATPSPREEDLAPKNTACSDARCSPSPDPQASHPGAGRRILLWQPAFGFAAAAAVIVLAGPWLAESAGQIATLSGLGNTFVGTTFVAFSTSLPELVASMAALRMGAIDLAIGNVFGSNAFNMLLLVPLDVLHAGPLLAHVSKSHALSCLGAILATSVAVMGQLYQVENRRRLVEPDALLMLLLILGALLLVYAAS